MAIIMSLKIRIKLADKIPPVYENEIRECFDSRLDDPIEDTREEHRTRPPTMWFIGETNKFRRLKVVFIQTRSGDLVVKAAYEPDEIEELIYEQRSRI
jgi:hypothetical protein